MLWEQTISISLTPLSDQWVYGSFFFPSLTEVLRRLKISWWRSSTRVLWEHVCKKQTNKNLLILKLTFKSGMTNSCCTQTYWLPVGSFHLNSCYTTFQYIRHTLKCPEASRRQPASLSILLEYWESCMAVGSSAVNQAEWMAGAVTLLALGTVGTDFHPLSAYSIRLACPKATPGNFLKHLFKLRRYFISKRQER